MQIKFKQEPALIKIIAMIVIQDLLLISHVFQIIAIPHLVFQTGIAVNGVLVQNLAIKPEVVLTEIHAILLKRAGPKHKHVNMQESLQQEL